MAKQDDWVRVTVRLPPELHARLLATVSAGPNSLNAEIVSRLQASLDGTLSSEAVSRVAIATTLQLMQGIQAGIEDLKPEEVGNLKNIMDKASQELVRSFSILPMDFAP